MVVNSAGITVQKSVVTTLDFWACFALFAITMFGETMKA